MNQDSRAGIAERYALATQSTDLGQRAGKCDADVLAAAALAARCVTKDKANRDVVDYAALKRVNLALAIYRYGITCDKSGIQSIVEACDDWLIC